VVIYVQSFLFEIFLGKDMEDTHSLWLWLGLIISRKFKGESLTKGNALTHQHSLFVEIHDGEFSGTWVFTSQHLAISAIADEKIREIISNFDAVGYLISLHSRDDVEE
jgi:hypothetical protein